MAICHLVQRYPKFEIWLRLSAARRSFGMAGRDRRNTIHSKASAGWPSATTKPIWPRANMDSNWACTITGGNWSQLAVLILTDFLMKDWSLGSFLNWIPIG